MQEDGSLFWRQIADIIEPQSTPDVATPLTTEQSSIDLELQQHAKDFAQRQNALAEKLQATSPSGSIENGFTTWVKPIDPSILRTSAAVLPSVNNLIDEQITFHTHTALPEEPLLLYPTLSFSQKLEVNTLHSLHVGVHMDPESKKQVDALLNARAIMPGLLETIYLFDEDGNAAKVSALPRSIIDNREDIGNNEQQVKYVTSPIEDADIKLVEKSLTSLEQAFTPAA